MKTTLDENGILNGIQFTNEEKFNFAFDIVDKLAEKSPDKLAMLHVDNNKTERRFTFTDISTASSRAANYFKSLGIKKGDRVMLVLKRHYQFWFAILALHKLGAIAIPATNLLQEHDFAYRFNAAERQRHRLHRRRRRGPTRWTLAEKDMPHPQDQDPGGRPAGGLARLRRASTAMFRSTFAPHGGRPQAATTRC